VGNIRGVRGQLAMVDCKLQVQGAAILGGGQLT